MKCAFCGDEFRVSDRIGKSDTCSRCGADLRCCKQCKFYDTHAYNDCREVRVLYPSRIGPEIRQQSRRCKTGARSTF
ncbi:MAG: hypothetical protein JRK53_19715 [Deltaproteobacteria bacterium]|nr:hypothetical protein [Deltaproteobacteria bacterium]